MQENIKQQLHHLSELHQNPKAYRIQKNSTKRYHPEDSQQISDWSQDQDHFYVAKKLNPERSSFNLTFKSNSLQKKKDNSFSQQKMNQTARKQPQFRSQSCELRPVKIKFAISQEFSGFHKSFYQKSFQQGIPPSNYTSAYEQYRMKKQIQKKQKLKDFKGQPQNEYKYQSSLVSRILNRRRRNYRQNSLLKDYLIRQHINFGCKK